MPEQNPHNGNWSLSQEHTGLLHSLPATFPLSFNHCKIKLEKILYEGWQDSFG